MTEVEIMKTSTTELITAITLIREESNKLTDEFKLCNLVEVIDLYDEIAVCEHNISLISNELTRRRAAGSL